MPLEERSLDTNEVLLSWCAHTETIYRRKSNKNQSNKSKKLHFILIVKYLKASRVIHDKKRITGEVLLVPCLIRHMTAPIGSGVPSALCYCLLRCPCTATAPIPPSTLSDHSLCMHQPCTATSQPGCCAREGAREEGDH